MFNDPESNISLFELEPGMKVADLGSGSGFYSIASAKAVLPDGLVYAVDVQKDLLEKLKTSSRQAHVSNIEIIWGDIEKLGGTKLREESIDAAIISNTLFQVEKKKEVGLEAKRILKTGGKLLVIDWTGSFGGMGPQPQDVFDEMKAKELFSSLGFHLEREISAGDHHYGLIFRKSANL